MAKLTLQILIFALASVSAHAEPLRICGTCAFKTIRQALAQAPSGATIEVGPGVYYESGLEVSKPVTLRAAASDSRPVLDAQGRGNVMLVRANGVRIEGLEFRNSGFGYSDDLAGLKVMDARDCEIVNNWFSRNQFGIYLGNVKFCRVAENKITGEFQSESLSGNGVHVWHGANLEIANNETSGNRDGLYFEFVQNSSVHGNVSRFNVRYGLHFMFSHFSQYRDNSFERNGSGVAVMYSKGIVMEGNRFSDSRGPAAYGLLLKDISGGTIGGNSFERNTVGIFLEGTTRSLFQANTFGENGWALRILGDCDSNSFTRNNFENNTFDVSTNSTLGENRFFLNHWSRYKGLDLNHDGIGDDVYYPVQLSTVLMERYGASVLLIDSFFFRLLDQLEAAMPILIPSALHDAQPSMLRVEGL